MRSFFNTLPPQSRQILNSIPALIEKTFPIPERFRRTLPSHIAELSRLLTGERGSRSLSYLNRPNFLSAYLYYFLPWNLYRLCRLLPALDLNLCAGSEILDLGSGPLTFVSALWIARPELRAVPLEFHCIDRSAAALEAGKKFFAAVSAGTDSPWKIKLAREEINVRRADVTRKKKNAALVCAVNMFNEAYEDLPHSNTEGLRRAAENIARIVHAQASADGRILTVEPGVPQSGKFIAFLRNAFLELGRPPLSPCSHTAACPLSGKKKRWCHFAFETTEAPKELHRLSSSAGIPKERLVFSFLLAGNTKPPDSGEARIISDAFPLPNNRFGRYGCCSRGLVLLTGEKSRIEKIVSGSLVAPVFSANAGRDAKSGALLAELSPIKKESKK
ncbi:MAG: small ribosomal subunit Rsm22 family protein [Treponema sp.]|jgi:ribosomal protein RSM22 (predicted rRNA methylase)|nr:small ribosomal subunit Rsm22 family protein [Treponema sp.]